jgi:hypothetical protein
MRRSCLTLILLRFICPDSSSECAYIGNGWGHLQLHLLHIGKYCGFWKREHSNNNNNNNNNEHLHETRAGSACISRASYLAKQKEGKRSV